jgi:hypothetical protein
LRLQQQAITLRKFAIAPEENPEKQDQIKKVDGRVKGGSCRVQKFAKC